MGFIKLSKKDLQHGAFENLIGMPTFQASKELLNLETFREESGKITTNRKISQREVFIPVVIEKVEQFELNSNGDIKDSRLTGKILLKNPGQGDKLWNLKVTVKDPVNEQGSAQHLIQELNAQQEWSKEYNLVKPDHIPLRVTEFVSSLSYNSENATRVSPIFVKDVQNYLFFTITVENISGNDVLNVEIFKRLPETIQKVLESKVESGKLDSDRGLLHWHIDLLKNSAKVTLTCKISVETKPTTSGSIQVKYSSREKFSDFYIQSLTGFARIGDFISIKEKDTTPGVWECSANFLNRSEFTLQLNTYDVKLNASDQASFINIGQPLQIYPGDQYEFPPWEVTTANRPVFFKHLDYTVKFEENFLRSGLIQMEELQINVFEVDASKSLSETVVPSFKEVTLDCSIKLQNSSTVPLNHFYIMDTVPKHFIPPTTDSIQILINGESFKWESVSGQHQQQVLLAQKGETNNRHERLKVELQQLQKNLEETNKGNASNKLQSVKDELTAKNAAIDTAVKLLNQNTVQKSTIQKSITEKEQAIQKTSANLEKIQNELTRNKELQDITNVLAKEGENKNTLLREEADCKQAIKQKETEITDVKTQIAGLEKRIKETTSKQDETKKNEDANNAELETVKQGLKADKGNQELSEKQKTLKAKLGEIKKELTQLKKDISSANGELGKVQGHQTQLGSDLVTLQEKLKGIEGQIEEKSKKINQLQDAMKNAPKAEVITAKIEELNTKINALSSDVSKVTAEVKDLKTKLGAIEQDLQKLNKEKDTYEKQREDLTKNYTNLADKNKLIEKIQGDLAEKEKQVSEAHDALVKIEEDLNKVSGKGVEEGQLDLDFDRLCASEGSSGVQIYITPNNNDPSTPHEIHMVFLNLEKIFKMLLIDQTLEVRYPLKTVGLNPQNQSEYLFPTIIKCNSKPIAAPYKFNIGQEKLPTLEIEHKRQSLSLGRIIDPYSEAGHFDISLLIKNASNVPLNNIEILDTVPKSAQIANTEYEYTIEVHSNPNLKNLVWKIEALLPFQELEINYLLSFKEDESYDLNNMDLTMR